MSGCLSLNVCCLNLCVTLLSTSLKPYTHFQYPFHSLQLRHAAFKETQFTTSTFTQEKKKAPSQFSYHICLALKEHLY